MKLDMVDIFMWTMVWTLGLAFVIGLGNTVYREITAPIEAPASCECQHKEATK